MSALVWVRVVVAVVRRPSLWSTALRQIRRLASPGWWRRWPFLPVPPADYRALRLATQYGGDGHPPEPRDVLHYITWCRRWDAGVR